MSVKHQLSELCGHFSQHRMADHTIAVVKGFNMSPMPVAVVRNPDYGKAQYGDQNYVTLADLASLRGVQRPIVFDPAAIREIMAESLEKIIDLESENRILRNKLTAISNIIDV